MIRNDCPNNITGIHVNQRGYEGDCATCKMINEVLSRGAARVLEAELRAMREGK